MEGTGGGAANMSQPPLSSLTPDALHQHTLVQGSADYKVLW